MLSKNLTFLGVKVVKVVKVFYNTRRPRKITRSLLSSLFRSSFITETDYTSVADRFGDIGSRSGYNRYMGNPQRFTQLEIESTTSFIQSLVNPKGDQPDEAD